MGKVREGGRAGLLAGLVYAALEATVVVTLLITYRNHVIAIISSELPSGSTVDVNSVYDSLVAVDAAVAVVFGILAGLVLGLVYGAVSDRIPGQRGVTKGLVFGFVLWLILHVVADYFENLKYGVTFYLVDIGLGLVTSLVFGGLLGIFFEGGMRKLVTPGESNHRNEMGSTPGSDIARSPPSTGSAGVASTPVNPTDGIENRP